MTLICARETCTNPVPRKPRGRPPIYCSPECRPSRANVRGLTVEVDHPEHTTDGRSPDRVWTVRLRRGRRAVVIADAVGWPSANALAGELRQLLARPERQKGETIG